MDEELNKWRRGEEVDQDQQVTIDMEKSISQVETQKALNRSVSNLERDAWEKERESLYLQLDEKDEEINQQSQLAEKLKEQMLEQEELIAATRRDYEVLQAEMARIQEENDAAKDEVKEVLQALEELALNYDQKSQEVESKCKENETLSEELNQKQLSVTTLEGELQELREASLHQKKRTAEMLASLISDMSEVGAVIGGSAVETGAKGDCNKKIDDYEKELGELRSQCAKHEVRMRTLQESMVEVESRKKQLEEQVDNLIEESTRLRASSASIRDSIEGDNENSSDSTRDLHLKQVTQLRQDISSKQSVIDDLKQYDYYYHHSIRNCPVEYDQLKAEYDKLKSEEENKNVTLHNLMTQNERKEQAQHDLKGLEETVAKELNTLHSLRKSFVQSLQARVKKAAAGEDEDLMGGSVAQKQKIVFLENNLDQLTKVHKQLVRDKADLRCELPKLEKRLRATMERVKALETALREAKDGAMRDRKRYQYEVDRIKEAVRQKNLARRGQGAHIAKPIRTGPASLLGRPGALGVMGTMNQPINGMFIIYNKFFKV
ncbi:Kinesin heavy chain, partial [Armadillidium nasatum]